MIRHEVSMMLNDLVILAAKIENSMLPYLSSPPHIDHQSVNFTREEPPFPGLG
jgi:hypothetical protein